MIVRFFQIVFGYVLACLAAGFVLALYATAPADPSGIVSELTSDRLRTSTRLALSVATHIAVYVAPVAIFPILVAEFLGLRGWLYAVFGGLGVSVAAFLAQFAAEAPAGATILNNYALAAFITAGICGGLIYWLVAGGESGSEPNDKAAESVRFDQGKQESDASTPAFTIKSAGAVNKTHHLAASRKLNEDDFYAIAKELGRDPIRARKIGFVAARKAEDSEEVETLWNGSETTNTASPGDWIVTNLSPTREVIRDKDGNENTYVISAKKFPKLYEETDDENEFGQVYKAKNVVEAIFLSGGFEIVAPWGQKQFADVGYLLSNNGDIYGNNEQTFKKTYEILD